MSKFDLKLSLSTIAIDTKIKHDNTMSLHKKTHFRKIYGLVNIAITHIFLSQDN